MSLNSLTTVFVGNCQVGALAALHKRIVSPIDGGETVYIANYESASPEQLRTIAEARTLVTQVLDFVPKIGDLPTGGTVHLVPHITAAFLWPCTGQPHPHNQPHRFSDASGPYNAELGDSFLNRMVLDGIDADEAVRRFMDTDIAALRHVDRVMELMLEKQRSRDEACGFRFADFIEANFRSVPLFRSPNHPGVALTLIYVAEVFARLGVESRIIEEWKARPWEDIFPATETPIHPSIARHFGLAYATPETRYRYFYEGAFTCEEYAGRYMRYTWDPLVGEGIELTMTGAHDAAIEVLRRAVVTSPRSATAHAILGDLLSVRGHLKEALSMARTAHELEPENAHFRQRLSQITEQVSAAA
jgi:GNAT superfamily N-acetyltransferase